MAKTQGAKPLTESELIDETLKRLNGEGWTRADVKLAVKALKEEIQDCLVNGYKVSLGGLVTLTPVAKAGRKKGTEVRNPFDGTSRKLRSDEPDKFKIKAKVSPAVAKSFPSSTSAAGRELLAQLTPAKTKVSRRK